MEKTSTVAKKPRVKSATEIQADALQDGQYLVTVQTGFDLMLQMDQEGKKLVFDFTNMPTFSADEIQQLSKPARSAYTQDMRLSGRAEERMADGRSAFSDTKDDIMVDPLAFAHVREKCQVQNKAEGTKYLFVNPDQVETLTKAGYSLVKKDDKEVVPYGEEVGGKMVIKDSKQNVSVVAVKVGQTDYDKHIAFYGNLSKQRLGHHLDETKEKLRRYAPKVNIYDESKLTR